MFDPDPDAPVKSCDIPQCPNPAGYRAPKDRNPKAGYHWFCLEHIRAYNAQWDYFKGMSSREIQEKMYSTFCWDRPTWKMSGKSSIFSNPQFSEEIQELWKTSSSQHAPNSACPPSISQALAILNLTWPVKKEILRQKYHFYARKKN